MTFAACVAATITWGAQRVCTEAMTPTVPFAAAAITTPAILMGEATRLDDALAVVSLLEVMAALGEAAMVLSQGAAAAAVLEPMVAVRTSPLEAAP